MREIVQGVFLEDRYPGVILGAVAADGGGLLIDTPLRIEDGREWLRGLGGPRAGRGLLGVRWADHARGGRARPRDSARCLDQDH